MTLRVTGTRSVRIAVTTQSMGTIRLTDPLQQHLIVPTLRVGMPRMTLRVTGTRSVRIAVTTQSVGTIG